MNRKGYQCSSCGCETTAQRGQCAKCLPSRPRNEAALPGSKLDRKAVNNLMKTKGPR